MEIKGHRVTTQEKAKFLGIIFDSKLKFDDQLQEMKGKVDKSISILRYLNRVSWGMEINTSLLIYKSYVRSIMEYGLFVYYPRDWKGKETLEKIQYKGIRIAMGYRNSTPTNVMLAESKLLRMEERAGYLARNFWARVIASENRELEGTINRLEMLDGRFRHVRSAGNINVFIESWRDTRCYKKQIDKCGTLDVYGGKYWAMTNAVTVDMDIGEERKTVNLKDSELMNRYREKYMLEEDYQIIFTDGSGWRKEYGNRYSTG